MAGVGADGHRVVRQKGQLHLLADQPLQHPSRRRDECAELDVHGLQNLSASEGQQLSRQLLRRFRGPLDLTKIFESPFVAGDLRLNELGRAHDHRQQVVEVVGDTAGKPAYHLQSLRMLELIGELPALGHVMKDDADALVRQRESLHVTGAF